METIISTLISALIGGGVTLIGAIITNLGSGKAIEQKLQINQAVTTEKLENLTIEVRKHNNFAERVPIIEHDVAQLKEDIKELKSR